MNYLQEFEQVLRSRLASAPQAKTEQETEQDWQRWSDSVVQFVRDAVLISYRNGQKSARGTRGSSGHGSALAAGKLKPVQPAQ